MTPQNFMTGIFKKKSMGLAGLEPRTFWWHSTRQEFAESKPHIHEWGLPPPHWASPDPQGFVGIFLETMLPFLGLGFFGQQGSINLISTWNPKHPVLNGCLVKEPISFVKIFILNHPIDSQPLINGRFHQVFLAWHSMTQRFFFIPPVQGLGHSSREPDGAPKALIPGCLHLYAPGT